MRILLLSLVASFLCLVGAAQADVLQDTCDTGMPDSIIVGAVQVPGPLWPDSIGVPVYIWADEDLASVSWGLRPTDNRLKVSSFSTEGTVFDRGEFLSLKVDTVNNCISFIWLDLTGSDPMPSPQGTIGVLYVKIAPNISVSEQLSLDSVTVSSAYKCRLTASRGIGSTCVMKSIVFLKGSGGNFTFGQSSSDAEVYLSFDEGGGVIVYDRSGHRHDGVMRHGVARVSGVSGSAIQFDGVDDSVSFAGSWVNYPTSMTISLWVKTISSTPTEATIMHDNRWQVMLTNNKYKIQSWDLEHGWVTIEASLTSIEDWHWLSFVRVSDLYLVAYVDGDSVAQCLINHWGGAWNWSAQLGPANCAIDEVKIYAHALTPAENLAEYLRVGYHRCGDIDDSREINVSDVVYLINYIFGSGAAPASPQAADVDCDGRICLTDAVYLISYMFGDGAKPCAGCPY